MAVGERYERLPPTAVVPEQLSMWDAQSCAHIQDTFKISRGLRTLPLVVLLFCCVYDPVGALEEVGRRKLLLVASDHHLSAAVDCADSVLWTNLRRLVKDDQIELKEVRIKKCTHGQGAHHQAWLELH